MVASATVRARQGATDPDWTCDDNRRRRMPKLEGVPISRLAEVVEIPRTAPKSATQNSASMGQPSPAMALRARTRRP